MNHNANYSSMPSPDMDPADRRQPEQARRPLSVATDNMMLEFYKKDGYELVSLFQHWEYWFGGGVYLRKPGLTGRLYLLMALEVACSSSFGTSSLMLLSVLSGTSVIGLPLFGPEVSTAFIADLLAIGTISS